MSLHVTVLIESIPVDVINLQSVSKLLKIFTLVSAVTSAQAESLNTSHCQHPVQTAGCFVSHHDQYVERRRPSVRPDG